VINSEKCSKPAWVESKFRANQVLSGKSRNGQFFVLFAKSLRTTLGRSCDLGFCGGRRSCCRGRPPMPNAGQRTQILARVSEILLPTMQEPPCASKRKPGASLRTLVEELRAGQPVARHVGPPHRPPSQTACLIRRARPYQIRTKPKCPLWLSHDWYFSALAICWGHWSDPFSKNPRGKYGRFGMFHHV
jgi:hypothetical protein